MALSLSLSLFDFSIDFDLWRIHLRKKNRVCLLLFFLFSLPGGGITRIFYCYYSWNKRTWPCECWHLKKHSLLLKTSLFSLPPTTWPYFCVFNRLVFFALLISDFPVVHMRVENWILCVWVCTIEFHVPRTDYRYQLFFYDSKNTENIPNDDKIMQSCC